MNDKDRVLPRLGRAKIEAIADPPTLHSYRIQLGRLGIEDLEKVAFAQRDADWKRIEPLIDACLGIKACAEPGGKQLILDSLAAALTMLKTHAELFGAFRDDVGQAVLEEINAALARAQD